MNQYHKQILDQIKKYESKKKWGKINRYLGTGDYIYCLKSGDFGEIAKKWTTENKNIARQDFLDLLDSLNKGKSFEEKVMVGTLLGKFSEFRESLDLKYLYGWLGNVEGWAEVDVICQSNFHTEEVLSRWKDWKDFLLRFNKDANIHRRRASLVLLTKSLRENSEKCFSDLAFQLIDTVKGEKEILITKAVSWLLRSLTKYHPKEVEEYLNQNKDTLPKIALRETWKKLKTGKKN